MLLLMCGRGAALAGPMTGFRSTENGGSGRHFLPIQPDDHRGLVCGCDV